MLEARKVSTNVFLRRVHNFAVGMTWLPWPVLAKKRWPSVGFKEKRGASRSTNWHGIWTRRNLLILAWVFSGGLRRKFPNQPHVSADIGIIIQAHKPPPPPAIIVHDFEPPEDGMA